MRSYLTFSYRLLAVKKTGTKVVKRTGTKVVKKPISTFDFRGIPKTKIPRYDNFLKSGSKS